MVEYHPQKYEPKYTQLTVGVNLIDFPGDVITPTVDTATSKIVWNSFFIHAQVQVNVYFHQKHYLGTPLTSYEYLRIPITLIPDEIIRHHNLLPIVINGFIYLDIIKGTYGLPQSEHL